MNFMELSDGLRYYISFVYNHEQEFIELFLPEYNNFDIEITECYFASARARLELSDNDTDYVTSTTVPLATLCDWVDNYNETN